MPKDDHYYISDVNIADALLLQFCRRVERLYGKSVITPNMHLHCHLKDVILDYGPVYAFWLFSYERFNGILQHQPTNNHCLEIQVMRRFLQDNNAYSFQPPEDFQAELDNLCNFKPIVLLVLYFFLLYVPLTILLNFHHLIHTTYLPTMKYNL